MKIIIDIPEEFEIDFKNDRFEEKDMSEEKEFWEVTVKLIIPKKDGDIEYAKESVTLALEEVFKNYNISSVVYDDMK